MKGLFSTLLTVFILMLFPSVVNGQEYGSGENWNAYASVSGEDIVTTGINAECTDTYGGWNVMRWDTSVWTSINNNGMNNDCNTGYSQQYAISHDGTGDFAYYAAFYQDHPNSGSPNASSTNSKGYVSWTYASTTGLVLDSATGCDTGPTRICDFNPQDSETVSGPSVDFDLELYVNDSDIGSIKGVTVTMRNIDQNVLLLGVFSPSDIVLLDEYQLEAGYFSYSTTSIPLGEGNYRLRVCLDTNYFGVGFGVVGGWISGAVGNVNLCESHQFVVGTSTFIGNISQNLWSDTQDFFGNSTATSSEALAATCNPFLSVFGIRECMAFLFVPDNNQLQITLTEARNAFLTRIPWGYFTRTVDIMSNSASSTLPAFSQTIQMGAGSDLTPATTTISFDINDMVAGAGSLVDTIQTPNGDTFRSVFYPIIQGTIALLVLLTIIADISNTHNHASGESREKTKTS